MAKVLSLLTSDTAISGVSSNSMPLGLINWGADWRCTKETPEEVIFSNMNSPFGYPETVRFASQRIANIYKGSLVESSERSQVSGGVQVLIQWIGYLEETDSADPSYTVKLPAKAHTVLFVSGVQTMTATIALTLMGRLGAGWFETGVNTPTRIAALLRGGLKPADL